MHTASFVEIRLHESMDARGIAEACIHIGTGDANLGMALREAVALAVTNLPINDLVLCSAGISLLRNVNHAVRCLLLCARGPLVKATWALNGSIHERDHLELDVRSEVSVKLRQVSLAEVDAAWSFHAVD